jgi:hypothetical protein
VTAEADYRAKIHEVVRRTRAEQGLPEKVSDPVVLDRVAELILRGEARAAKRAADARRVPDQGV